MNQEGSSNEKWCPVDKWTTTLGTDYNVPASQTQGTKQCIMNVMFYMSKLKVKVTRGGQQKLNVKHLLKGLNGLTK